MVTRAMSRSRHVPRCCSPATASASGCCDLHASRSSSPGSRATHQSRTADNKGGGTPMSTRDFIEKDYYAVLGVPKDADKAAIRKAYRTLARQYHPDANAGDSKAEDKFKEISEAYDVLSDEARRREYDEARTLFAIGYPGGFRGGTFRPGGNAGGGMQFDLGDLFGGGGLGDLFGGVFGGRRMGPRRGADVESDVTMDFVDSVHGATVPVRLSAPHICDTCHGNGARPGTSPQTCPVCNGS